MGIKNLNSIIKRYNKNNEANLKFDHLVVDGSNIICAYLNIVKKNMKDEYYVDSFTCYKIDFVKQTKYLIVNCVELIISELNKFITRYDIGTIWFISDPAKTKYKIDIDKFRLFDKELFEEEYAKYINEEEQEETTKDNKKDINEERKKERIIINNIKDDEQTKRTQSRNTNYSKAKKIFEELEERENIKKYLSNKRFDIDIFTDIYKQSYGYEISNYVMTLIDIIRHILTIVSIGSVYKSDEKILHDVCGKVKAKINFIDSKDEADIVIKNVCKIISEIYDDNKILMISRDTDYGILLADIETVYISDLHTYNGKDLCNPFSLWNTFFKPLTDKYDNVNINDYIIRLSAMFGNDYTNKVAICCIPKADEIKDNFNAKVLSLFDMDSDEYFKTSTNISKIITFIRNQKEIIKLVKDVEKEIINISEKYDDENIREHLIRNERQKLLLTCEEFDKYIKRFAYTEINIKNVNKQYYKKYMYSVCIYSNYQYFNNFDANNKIKFDAPVLDKINNNLHNKFNTLYSFKYNKNPLKILKHAKEISDVKEYYKLIDIDNICADFNDNEEITINKTDEEQREEENENENKKETSEGNEDENDENDDETSEDEYDKYINEFYASDNDENENKNDNEHKNNKTYNKQKKTKVNKNEDELNSDYDDYFAQMSN